MSRMELQELLLLLLLATIPVQMTTINAVDTPPPCAAPEQTQELHALQKVMEKLNQTEGRMEQLENTVHIQQSIRVERTLYAIELNLNVATEVRRLFLESLGVKKRLDSIEQKMRQQSQAVAGLSKNDSTTGTQLEDMEGELNEALKSQQDELKMHRREINILVEQTSKMEANVNETLQTLVNKTETYKEETAARKLWQCSWPDLNTDIDDGQIVTCTIDKVSADSALRVTFRGQIRAYSSSTSEWACSSWYITLNGAECNPASIDVQMNVEPELNTARRPSGDLDGLCTGLPAGPVDVTLKVGKCGTGEALSDARTGTPERSDASLMIIEEVPMTDLTMQ